MEQLAANPITLPPLRRCVFHLDAATTEKIAKTNASIVNACPVLHSLGCALPAANVTSTAFLIPPKTGAQAAKFEERMLALTKGSTAHCSLGATCPNTEMRTRAIQSGGKAPDLKVCHGCRMAAYCDRECQKAHWPEHRATCKYYSALFKELQSGDSGGVGTDNRSGGDDEPTPLPTPALTEEFSHRATAIAQFASTPIALLTYAWTLLNGMRQPGLPPVVAMVEVDDSAADNNFEAPVRYSIFPWQPLVDDKPDGPPPDYVETILSDGMLRVQPRESVKHLGLIGRGLPVHEWLHAAGIASYILKMWLDNIEKFGPPTALGEGLRAGTKTPVIVVTRSRAFFKMLLLNHNRSPKFLSDTLLSPDKGIKNAALAARRRAAAASILRCTCLLIEPAQNEAEQLLDIKTNTTEGVVMDEAALEAVNSSSFCGSPALFNECNMQLVTKRPDVSKMRRVCWPFLVQGEDNVLIGGIARAACTGVGVCADGPSRFQG